MSYHELTKQPIVRYRVKQCLGKTRRSVLGQKPIYHKKIVTEIVNHTTIADPTDGQLEYQLPYTGIVKPVYIIQTFPLTGKADLSKDGCISRSPGQDIGTINRCIRLEVFEEMWWTNLHKLIRGKLAIPLTESRNKRTSPKSPVHIEAKFGQIAKIRSGVKWHRRKCENKIYVEF